MIALTPYWLMLLFGLALGSFNNVLIYRIPRGASLLRPVSSCPGCSRPIRPWENVPLFSWLFLRGRCSGCGMHIPFRYPLVEALTGLLFLALALRWPMQPQMLFFAPLLSLLVALSFIDLDTFLLPNPLVLAMAICGAAGLTVIHFLGGSPAVPTVLAGLLGAFAGASSLLLTDVFSRMVFHRRGMGFGDVKLMGAVGLYLGWEKTLLSFLLASFAGAFVMLLLRRSIKQEVPFGPWLALGTVLALFFGDAIIHWYLRLVLG